MPPYESNVIIRMFLSMECIANKWVNVLVRKSLREDNVTVRMLLSKEGNVTI